VASGKPQSFEWRHTRADGSELDASVSLAPARLNDKPVVLCTWHDITWRKTAERALAASEARFRHFFEANSSVMLLIEPVSGVIINANQAASKYYGYSLAELIGMPIARINTMTAEAVAQERQRALRQERSHFNFTHRLASGELRDVEVYSSPIDSGNRPVLFSIVHDITERTRAENTLKLAASVFSNAREGILITDAEGCIVDVNETFSRITGYTRDEAVGRNPRLLKSERQSPEFYASMWQGLIDKGHWYGEVWNRRKDGEIYAEMLNISAVRDDAGRTINYVALFTDITPIKAHQQQLEHIAHYDALTSLPNRVLLADRLQQAMARTQRHGRLLAVAYLDLDGFKAINDQNGHDIGDELLIAVARRMKSALREGDTLARLGGDEFVAVIADLEQPESCELVLGRLLQAASEPVPLADKTLQVSASIGVTLYPQDGADTDKLLRHADQAMYLAKQAGKNRFHLFDVDQDMAVKTQRESLERIRQAFKQHEFVLYFQIGRASCRERVS
jgi:diguanylate cyclase (GGDEF)-like protein/PAS domain S-box-containing protein